MLVQLPMRNSGLSLKRLVCLGTLAGCCLPSAEERFRSSRARFVRLSLLTLLYLVMVSLTYNRLANLVSLLLAISVSLPALQTLAELLKCSPLH